MNVIADAIAFKHELVPLNGPNFDDPIGESPFGHFSSGCRKKSGTEGKFESDIDMSLSNSSIGANAPAAAFGKTAALEDV